MVKVLVEHGSVVDNLGDLAMLEGAYRRIIDAMPDLDLTVIYRGVGSSLWKEPGINLSPDYVIRPNIEKYLQTIVRQRSYGLAARITALGAGSWQSAGRVMLEVNGRNLTADEFASQYDGLLLTGGGYLNDIWPYELIRRCILMQTFADLGKPVVLTGQQIGPFQSGYMKSLLARTLRRVSFVGLREQGDSWDYCRKFGLAPAQFQLVGDDSLGLPPAGKPALDMALSELGLTGKKFFAFHYRVNTYYPEFSQYIAIIGRLITGLSEDLGAPALFIPIDVSTTKPDLTTAAMLQESIPEKSFLKLENPNITPALVKAVIGQAIAAVGSSYHFCVFALCQAVPTVCLYDGRYYSQKAKGLAEFWGEQGLLAGLKGAEVAGIENRIMATISNPGYKEALALKSNQAVQSWNEEMAEIVVRHFSA